jgi:hypothetical protein
MSFSHFGAASSSSTSRTALAASSEGYPTALAFAWMGLLLDGTDLDSALRSLGAAARMESADLASAIDAYDDADFEPSAEESPAHRIPRQIFARVGVDVGALDFDTARYFHGTRVRDPTGFLTRGILPLGPMVDELWSMLYELVRDERTESEWNEFRKWVMTDGREHAGHLHRLKLADRIHHGPHGVFVRERLLNPTPPAHDYLGGPETVEDIAECYELRFGDDLFRRFCDETTPCIVVFDSTRVSSSGVYAVFWLAFGLIREGEVGSNSDGGVAFDGEPVTPEKITHIEVCEPAVGRDRFYRPTKRIVP